MPYINFLKKHKTHHIIEKMLNASIFLSLLNKNEGEITIFVLQLQIKLENNIVITL